MDDVFARPNIVVAQDTNAGDIASLFHEASNGDGNKTYTDSELHELLGFVESMDNVTTANDRECTRTHPQLSRVILFHFSPLFFFVASVFKNKTKEVSRAAVFV